MADLRAEGDKLLEELAAAIDQDDLAFDENDECAVTFNDSILLHLHLDEDLGGIVINLPLGGVPDNERREELLYDLLCGNYCWGLTEGGTLGVDRETTLVCLTCLVTPPLADGVQFQSIVAGLLNAAAYWMRRLASSGEEPATEAPVEEPGGVRV